MTTAARPTTIEARPANNRIEMVGKRFGKLTVLSLVDSGHGIKSLKWLCQCDCGKTKPVDGSHLRSGHTASCGCFSINLTVKRNLIHGESKTPLYRRWLTMMRRCYWENGFHKKYYMDRGIGVDPDWHTFLNFKRDMAEGFLPYLTIERKDNEKGYSKDNCKWATRSEQAFNRRPKGTT